MVSGIVDDAPGAAVGEDEGSTAGATEAVAVACRGTGALFQRSQGREGNDVVLMAWAPFDRVEATGILRDETDSGVGRGEVDNRG